MSTLHGTTIIAVRKGGHLALGGDGQISIGDTVVKATANKVVWFTDGASACTFGLNGGENNRCFDLRMVATENRLLLAELVVTADPGGSAVNVVYIVNNLFIGTIF